MFGFPKVKAVPHFYPNVPAYLGISALAPTNLRLNLALTCSRDKMLSRGNRSYCPILNNPTMTQLGSGTSELNCAPSSTQSWKYCQRVRASAIDRILDFVMLQSTPT